MAVTEAAAGEHRWVLRVPLVAASVRALMGHGFHRYFPAYLHLRQVAGRGGVLGPLDPDWQTFGQTYLSVQGGHGRPFFTPFLPLTWSADRAWLNSNLAGSWAGSSIRAGQPPSRVLQYNGDGTFTLKQQHWRLARQHLLDNKRVPVLPLAAFLYRDFGFDSSRRPEAGDLIDVFRRDFAYETPRDDDEFAYLYEIAIPDDADTWFERFKPEGSSDATA